MIIPSDSFRSGEIGHKEAPGREGTAAAASSNTLVGGQLFEGAQDRSSR